MVVTRPYCPLNNLTRPSHTVQSGGGPHGTLRATGLILILVLQFRAEPHSISFAIREKWSKETSPSRVDAYYEKSFDMAVIPVMTPTCPLFHN